MKLTFDNIMRLLDEKTSPPSESRTEEFYAVAQLLAEGDLTANEQKQLGEKCRKIIESDNWWRSNGAFNDE